MIQFVGREEELSKIHAFLQKPNPGIAVVFGRRRIGKTELIRHGLIGRKYISFEGLENRSKADQLDAFLFQLSQQTGNDFTSKKSGIKSWKEAFALLIPLVESEGYHLVFDEFQWMANYRSEIVSDLKLVWDQYLSQNGQGTKLILCGSIASYMTNSILQSKALYGRVDLVIGLSGFHLWETREILGSERALEEVLEAHMLVGGVPRYLELLQAAPSVRLGMEQEGFTRYGYFTEEYTRIFLGHFGRNPDYETIVATLAKHPYGLLRKELIKHAKLKGGGALTRQIDELESAGFVSSHPPFHRTSSSPLRKYFLSDPYLRFYFAFIFPKRKQIHGGQQKGSLFARICDTSEFYAWKARAFENLCFAHASWLADELKFSAVEYQFGPFFRSASPGSPGVQIDMIFDRADHVITLCEAKYQRKPVGKAIIKEVDAKVAAIEEQFPKKTIQKVLIAPNGATEPVVSSRYFLRVLGRDDLERMSRHPHAEFSKP